MAVFPKLIEMDLCLCLRHQIWEKRGVKRDLMLCMTCPVMGARQDIHQPKVDSLLNVFSDQNKHIWTHIHFNKIYPKLKCIL